MLSSKFLALALSIVSFTAPAVAIWPQPKQIKTGSSALKLAHDFKIQLASENAPKDLSDAVARTSDYLKKDKLAALVPDRGASRVASVSSATALKSLKVQYTSGAGAKAKSLSEEATAPFEERSEGYSLTIPADGSDAILQANSTLGLYRGLTTFSQIWYDVNGETYTLEAPFAVEDSPSYPYRGFMLDTARNFFPVSDIKRTLDAMSWVKINTFHWHVVDSQSFPLHIPGFPELADKGSYGPMSSYSVEDVKDIVAYAAARGIDVIAEIDMPGHTSIISQSHPEHIACAEATPWAQFANEPPAGQLRLASPATQNFTANVLTSASTMFKSKYFGTGGDEINAHCYETDEATQKDLKAQGLTLDGALDKFTQATHGALKTAGKTPVVWEEMLLEHNVTLSKEALVWVWISSANAASVAKKGYKIIHAPSDYFYLDCGRGGWPGNFVGNSWCDPFKAWQYAWTFNPLTNITAEQKHLVMGGEQLLWTEQSGPQNLDSIVWTRAAASAEIFWTGGGGDLGKAMPRMHELVYRFNQRGVAAVPVQPEWCALRPGKCDIDA